VNNDADTQTFSNTVLVGAGASFNAASGPLTFSSLVSIVAGNTLSLDGAGAFSFKNFNGLGTLTKNGAGTMTWSPTVAQESDFAISAGTVNTTADGSTDTFNLNSSLAVNGTSIVNFNENTTFDSAPLTRASGATVTVAAGKTLTIQNGTDATITGGFLNNNASTIAVTGAGSTFTTTSSFTINGGSTTNITAGGSGFQRHGPNQRRYLGRRHSDCGWQRIEFRRRAAGDRAIRHNTGSLTFSNISTGAFGPHLRDFTSTTGTNGTLNINSGATVTGTSLVLANNTGATTGAVSINGRIPRSHSPARPRPPWVPPAEAQPT